MISTELFTKILSTHNIRNFTEWHQQNNTPAHNARLLSCYGSMAGSWLLSIPKDKHSTILPETFRHCCLLRLGLEMPSTPNYCRACKTPMDPTCTHLFSCVHYRQLLTHRHDAIINDLKELASSAGVQAKDKNLTIFRVEDETDGHRPDLKLAKQGTNGRDLHLDITVSHPTCQSYVGYACKERGHTIKKKIKEKNDKYTRRNVKIKGIVFFPLPLSRLVLHQKE